MSKIVRLQFEVDEGRLAEIDRLMKMAGVRTRKEFFNAALTFLRWAMLERRQGRVIASVDENQRVYKELEMPVLSAVEPTEIRERREQGYRLGTVTAG